jgi:hypothetical protein
MEEDPKCRTITFHKELCTNRAVVGMRCIFHAAVGGFSALVGVALLVFVGFVLVLKAIKLIIFGSKSDQPESAKSKDDKISGQRVMKYGMPVHFGYLGGKPIQFGCIDGMSASVWIGKSPQVRITHPQPMYARRALKYRIDFFISYRISEAETYAFNLSKALQEKGHRTFMAGQQNLPNFNSSHSETEYQKLLKSCLKRPLRDSLIFLCVGSKTFPKSDWLQWEYETFEHDREGKIIGIATADSSERARYLIQFLTELNGFGLFEGDTQWLSQVPSDEVILAAHLCCENFKDELEFGLIASRWGQDELAEAYLNWKRERAIARSASS